MSHRCLLPAVILLAFAGSAAPTAAQGVPASSLSGTIQAPDGARLPGVLVTVSLDGRQVSQVVSGDQGVYRVSGLDAGHYTLRASLDGFRPTAFEIHATAGDLVARDITLQIESLVETVNVVGRADRESLEVPRIRESGARDVGEALAGLAGVWKVRRGAIANDVVVRGYQGENVTVLIDGARLYGACPNNMDPAAFHVDFSEVDRIEIGKGPFDVKNQGGLGAAVNIVTKRPPAGAHATAQVSAGSFAYVNPTVTASYGNGSAAILGGYSSRSGNPYLDGSGQSMLATSNYKASAYDLSAFDVNTAWMRVDLAAKGAHGLQASATRQRADRMMYPYLQMDATFDDADRFNLAYDYHAERSLMQAARIQAYATSVHHDMTDELRLTSAGMSRGYSMATDARTWTQGVKAEATLSGVTAGVETYRREWNAETQMAGMKYQPQYSIPDVVIMSYGVFAEYTRHLGSSVTLDAGGRVDVTSSEADASKANTALYMAYQGRSQTFASDTYPTGKIRLAYKASENLTLNAGLGHTVRVPDPQERYFALKRAGTDWVGNPFLVPTTNTGVEVGAAWRAGRLFLNVAAHRDALSNNIGVYDQVRVASVAGVMNSSARSYRNTDGTMTGAEVEATVSITDRLFASADVSAVRGQQTVNAAAGVNSPWLAEMPPVRSRLALRYERRAANHSGFAEIEGIYSAGQTHVDTDLRESPTPPYALFNTRVGGTYGHTRFALGVANLLNRNYMEHLSYQRDPFRTGAKVYEPGRNVYVNVALVF
jgi:iron complex outermembrane recepter protein